MFLALADQVWRDLSGPKPAPSTPAPEWPNPKLWKDAVNAVFRFRPVDLQQYMEQFWAAAPAPSASEYHWQHGAVRRSMAEPVRIGKRPLAAATDAVDGYNRPAVPMTDELSKVKADQPRVPENPLWRHLIYSYMIENTRIVEIFYRVLHEIFHGERLGRPTESVMNWAHLTERLAFNGRDGHWQIPPLSLIRPDPGALRRNAYYRLFGMDLSHGLLDGRPYPYHKPEAANREFISIFEALQMNVWRAYTNRKNTSGVDSTDDAGMADLCNRLENMLRVRRHAGALSQHEFYCDSVLSWFHLTVSSDNDIVYWLQAQAHDESTRLRAIGERVGVPPHTHSYEYFEIADYLQEILFRIERGDFSDADSVTELYKGDDGELQQQNQTTSKMTTIINHWAAATGRNLKEFAGAPIPRPRAPRPLALPAPRVAAVQIDPSRAPVGR